MSEETAVLLKTNIEQLQKQTSNLTQAVHSAQNVNRLTEIETLENPLAEALPLQGKLSIRDVLQQELDKLSLQLEMLQQENQELIETHSNLSNKYQQLSDENAVYQADAEKLPKEREQMANKKSEMREKINNMNQKAKNFHELCIAEQEACQQFKKQQFEQIAKLQAQVDILEQNKKLVVKRLQDLQNEDVNNATLYLKQAKEIMGTMQRKVEFLKDKAVDTRRQGRKMEGLVEASTVVSQMKDTIHQSTL